MQNIIINKTRIIRLITAFYFLERTAEDT